MKLLRRDLSCGSATTAVDRHHYNTSRSQVGVGYKFNSKREMADSLHEAHRNIEAPLDNGPCFFLPLDTNNAKSEQGLKAGRTAVCWKRGVYWSLVGLPSSGMGFQPLQAQSSRPIPALPWAQDQRLGIPGNAHMDSPISKG
jgi:hypothetical protein